MNYRPFFLFLVFVNPFFLYTAFHCNRLDLLSSISTVGVFFLFSNHSVLLAGVLSGSALIFSPYPLLTLLSITPIFLWHLIKSKDLAFLFSLAATLLGAFFLFSEFPDFILFDSLAKKYVSPFLAYDAFNIFSVFGGNRLVISPYSLLLKVNRAFYLFLITLGFYAGYKVLYKRKYREESEVLDKTALLGASLALAGALFLPGQTEFASSAALGALAVPSHRKARTLKVYFLLSLILAAEAYMLNRLALYAEIFIVEMGVDPRLRIAPFGCACFFAKAFLLFSLVKDLFSYKQESPFKKEGFCLSLHPQEILRKIATLPKSPKVRFIDWGFIFLIAGISFGLTFFNLGSFKRPQTGTSFSGKVLLTLPEGKSIQRILLYKTYNTIEVSVQCNEDSEPQTATFHDHEPYQWEERRLRTPCKDKMYLSLQLDKNTEAYELYFNNGKGERIYPKWSCEDNANTICKKEEVSKLFDEPDLVKEIPNQKDGGYFDEHVQTKPGLSQIDFGEKGLEDFVHPFIGKDLVTLSMRFFGVSPFAWRIPDAFLGALLPLLVLWFSWWVFNKRSMGYLSAFLVLMDLARLGLSRLTTTDSQLSFWMVLQALCLWGFLRRFSILMHSKNLSLRSRDFSWLLVAGIALGCAGGTKWSGFFLLPVLFASALLVGSALWTLAPRPRVLFFYAFSASFCLIFVPAFLYLMGYAFVLPKSSEGFIPAVFSITKRILAYHKTYSYYHHYHSQFLEWPWVSRPQLLFADNLKETEIRLYLFANPLLWWSILPSLFYVIFKPALKRIPGAAFTLILFLSSYLPWLAIRRVTFIYHFCPIAPFGAVLVAFLIQVFLKTRPLLARGYLILILLGFIVYLPITLGWEMPTRYFDAVSLFPDWFTTQIPEKFYFTAKKNAP